MYVIGDEYTIGGVRTKLKRIDEWRQKVPRK